MYKETFVRQAAATRLSYDHWNWNEIYDIHVAFYYIHVYFLLGDYYFEIDVVKK